MKSVYTYYDIVKLKLRMSEMVKKLKYSMIVNKEAKSIANEMESYINEYDTVLNGIGILGKVVDLKMVNAFNQTSKMLDKIEEKYNELK